MRRWFKVLVVDAGDSRSYYAAPPRVAWEQCLVYSMPHQDRLLEVLNATDGVFLYLSYTGPGDPARCYGETADGDEYHMHQPPGDTGIITHSPGGMDGVLISGFVDKFRQSHPGLLDTLSTPPLNADGTESSN